MDLVANAYNFDLVEENVRLDLGLNQISDAFLGHYSVNVEEIMSGPNGLCYKLTTNVTLTDSMTSIFGIFIYFHVPADEIPKMFRGFFESVSDFSALNYKAWPGSKPYTFEINILDSNVVAIERQVWNFYEHNQQRNCVYYHQDFSYVHCFAKNVIKDLASKCKPNLCSTPSIQSFLELTNQSWRFCRNYIEEKCVINNFALSFVHAESQCQVPCNVTEYKGEIRRMPLEREDKRTYLGIINKSNSISVMEEILIYDALTLIGTVGGSLGLFIGFSFYDFGHFVTQFLCKLCLKESKNEQIVTL